MRVDVRALSRDESLALLGRHHVGRLGIGLHDLIRVELTAYLYADDWIYVRTNLGEDLEIIRRHPWAAFEVDEIESVFDWRSAEVTGAMDILSSDPHSEHRFEYEEAVRLLRAVVPSVLTAEDAYPERVQLLRIHADTVRGSESRTIEGQPVPDSLPPASH